MLRKKWQTLLPAILLSFGVPMLALTNMGAARATPEPGEYADFGRTAIEVLQQSDLFEGSSHREIIRVLEMLEKKRTQPTLPKTTGSINEAPYQSDGDPTLTSTATNSPGILTEDGVRNLTPQEIERLKAVNTSDGRALSELMAAMSIPANSIVLLTSAGGVACPVDAGATSFSLLFISFGSSYQNAEPSETCREFMQMLMDDSTLDRIGSYLDLLGRSDRDRILNAMIQYLAAVRFGISPSHLAVIMMDLRPNQDLNPVELERRQSETRIRMQELLNRVRQENQNPQSQESN